MMVRFRSGSSTPRSAARKRGPASTRRTRTPLTTGKGLHDLVPLPPAKQAVVDEDPGNPIPDGPVQEGRRHRGIDSAGQGRAAPGLPPPTRSRMVVTLSSMMFAGAPDRGTIAESRSRICAGSPNPGGYGRPRGGTGGRRAAARNERFPAMGAFGLEAMVRNPSGRAVTRSPWLIQTSSSPSPSGPVRSSMPRSRSEWPRGANLRHAELARASAESTAPPKRTAIACMP